jgi:hypothetical protein
VIEDAQFNKLVPNQFVVELPPDEYQRSCAPIEQQLGHPMAGAASQPASRPPTAGRGGASIRFGGQVAVSVRPAADLAAGQARIRSRLAPDVAPAERPPGPLPALPGSIARWPPVAASDRAC